MTLQPRPVAGGDDSDCPHVEFSRLLCDDGHSARCRDGTARTQDSRGLTAGLLPVWMLHRVCGKEVVDPCEPRAHPRSRGNMRIGSR